MTTDDALIKLESINLIGDMHKQLGGQVITLP